MNKKMLWGVTLPGCVVLALVWAMLALSGNSLANPPDGDGNHNHGEGGGGGGGGGGNIAVTVTFDDLPGDGLMSDCHDCPSTCECLSPYADDVDNVGAQIDQQGNLAFGIGKAKRNHPAIRTLFFDFSDCASADPADCTRPFFDDGGLGSGFTNALIFTAGVDLRAMALLETRDDLSLCGTFDPSEESQALRFFFDPLDDRCPGSSTITVTRIDADTWEIEAALTDVACLREGGHDPIQRGLYHMPFKFTVQTN